MLLYQHRLANLPPFTSIPKLGLYLHQSFGQQAVLGSSHEQATVVWLTHPVDIWVSIMATTEYTVATGEHSSLDTKLSPLVVSDRTTPPTRGWPGGLCWYNSPLNYTAHLYARAGCCWWWALELYTGMKYGRVSWKVHHHCGGFFPGQCRTWKLYSANFSNQQASWPSGTLGLVSQQGYDGKW